MPKCKMMKSNDEKESIMLDPRNSEESMTNEKEENLESGTPRTENSFQRCEQHT